MPVTPFHVGPAIVLKAAYPRHFSLGVFTLVQVVIDVEPVWNIVTGQWPVHGRLHTLAGALLLSGVVIVPGKLGLSALYRRAGRLLEAANWPAWLRPGPISWTSATLGALIGGLSHVLLDAVIHFDVRPFAPWSAANPLLIRGSFLWMHLLCVLTGIVGILLRHVLTEQHARPA